ncbi:interferon regulatory factor 3 [Gouania willdenowi]|uniref:Interferon regulatory factor 3-like n=1 Tax=Gouania willdenowi TaxID=441366 RepID=A0A8C5GXI5_GOUWI|nr:interferon regulatory factor 3-like [Gouania willdenowi]
MAHPKPLLIPWLREQINSNQYPGVRWTNPKQTEFSIPWKHGLRHDSRDNDILIFKAWAEVSGNGQAHGDASVWKRNFRSALRAKGFRLVSDMQKDDANPHKVYHWPEEAAVGVKSCAGSQEQDNSELLEESSQFVTDDSLYLTENTIFIAKEDILQECLKDLNIGPGAEGTAGFQPPPEQQQLQTSIVIGAHPLPGQQQYPVMVEGAACEAGLPEQPAHPMGEDVGGAIDEQFVAQFQQTMSNTSDRDHFKTQFRVTVYYRGVKVSEQLVENEAGFRLVYRPEMVGMAYDDKSGLTLVTLPSPVAMLDQTQACLTQRILDNMGDGVEVGMSGYVVYGQRYGESKAFWSLSNFNDSVVPQEISKLEPLPLYPMKDFFQGIKDFIDGGPCPPASLFLCLGEKWPDKRPWVKKLVTVEVVLTSLKLLNNMAIEGGASSLQSVELQLSLDEMMEVC